MQPNKPTQCGALFDCLFQSTCLNYTSTYMNLAKNFSKILSKAKYMHQDDAGNIDFL